MTSTSTFSILTLLQSNCPAKAGQLASKKFFFGAANRYSVAAIHSRFETVTWFVYDEVQLDAMGLPEVLRIEKTLADALAPTRAHRFEVGDELELLLSEEAHH